jgi:NAD(P)-dependent dehydrogenase (short-subunit alcohol dehydrogenase family)
MADDIPPGLTGVRTLVTGGTRGIGAATALLFARAGAEVVVAARTAPKAGTIDPCRYLQADVATAAGAAELAAHTLELLGGIDVLVSNVGGQVFRPDGALAFTDEDWQHDLDTNLLSAVRVDRALLPRMIEQGAGTIVHVGSNAAKLARPTSLPYSAAKAALTAYSKGLAKEVGPAGIRVNIVLPGLIRTEALDERMRSIAAAQSARTEDVLERTVDSMQIPLRRVGEARDVAALIAFLASPAAAYLTGSQYTVDGGLLPTA